jgi:hypothetical protein
MRRLHGKSNGGSLTGLIQFPRDPLDLQERLAENPVSKIRTALVGCGKVGQTHAAALRDLRDRTTPEMVMT